MPVKSIVDDYLFAAMVHAKGTRAENGTLVLTVPNFPGIIACGGDARQAFDELYRLLEDWGRVSYEKGYSLPAIETENGIINLNIGDDRDLIKYHQGTSPPQPGQHHTYIGEPDEFERFLQER